MGRVSPRRRSADSTSFFRVPTISELEQLLSDRLDALPPAARAQLLRVLMPRDFDRAGRIGEFWASPATRSFGELFIDLEEDGVARAVVAGILREAGRGR
jgi:hypothetical protein